MEALSIHASNLESLRVTHVEFHLGFSSLEYKRKGRRKRSHFDCSMFAKGGSGVALVSRQRLSGASHYGCNWMNPRLHLGLGFSGRVMGCEVALLGECNGGPVNALVGLALEVEDQIVGNNIGREDCEESLELTDVCEGGSVDLYGMNGVRESSESPFGGNGDSNDGESIGCDDNSKEDTSMQIHVHGIVRSLEIVKSVEAVGGVLEGMGRMPLQVHSCVISTLGRRKKLDTAFAVVGWLKKKAKDNDGFDEPNVFVYNSLLGAVKASGQFEKVAWVMDDMTQNGVAPDVTTYDVLMAIYVYQGRADNALSLFEDLPKKGLSPSPSSYSTAMLAYRRLEDGIGAVKLYCMVKEKFQKGELGDYNEDWHTELTKLRIALARVCYQVIHQWLLRDCDMSTDVLKLLTYMDEAGTSPNRNAHEKLIRACSSEQHYPVVRELYYSMRKKNYKMRLSVCNHAISLMGKARMWWGALEMYEDMLEKGPKPCTMSSELVKSCFNVMLTKVREIGKWRQAFKFLNKMEEKGLKPGIGEWNSVLIACARSSATVASVLIFGKMVDQGLKPTTVTYGALLSALEKGKQYDKAIQVWEHMTKTGIKQNIHTFTIMATVYVALGQFHEVDLILQKMVSTRNNPTVVTFNAIITCCGRNGWGDAAYQWFNKMRDYFISADEVTYEILIEALSKSPKPEMAYEMYLRACKEGLSFVTKAYDAVKKDWC